MRLSGITRDLVYTAGVQASIVSIKLLLAGRGRHLYRRGPSQGPPIHALCAATGSALRSRDPRHRRPDHAVAGDDGT